jgi:maleylpyruvate isomerase
MTALRLYTFWRSSSAWRVRIGLALKGLPHELVTVNLAAGEQFDAAHRARSPLAQVPVLEVEEGGRTLRLVQSMAILEWLDERFSSPPLLPPDPEGRARVRALAEHVNSGTQPLQNAVVLRTLKEKLPGYERVWAQLHIGRGLEGLEQAVNDGGAGRFCHGDAPGLADCYLVPQLYNARRYGVDVEPFPTLRRIEEACAALPAFQAAHPDRQPDAPPPERRTP